MIETKDRELMHRCLDFALSSGACDARIQLNRSTEDLVSTLDGEIDKITRCEDSSAVITLFVDGRYGTFSTNCLDERELKDFIAKAVQATRMLEEDSLRRLPDPERCCRNALSGDELELYDPGYETLTSQKRRAIALEACVTGKCGGPDWKLISEEGEFSDSLNETYLADTQGLDCLHRETNFDYAVEVTIQDSKGERYSSWWWESAQRLSDLDISRCGLTAVGRAEAQRGSAPIKSGKYNMVVECSAASRMISPILDALNGFSLQQHNSFLDGSLGKKVFPEGMTLMDLPHIKGDCCSKLFDAEGVATREGPIIEKGVVKEYFLSTYTAGKMGLEPTVAEYTRPKLLPWPETGTGCADLLKKCGSGILVREFNGGNCNSATGDFSYGIEGFWFENGKILKPVGEMLVTGNFLTLWKNFVAAADDPRKCMSKLIPTLAFSNVDFSG